MSGNRTFKSLVVLACVGITLILTATCNPLTGTLDLYRSDDYFDDSLFFDEIVYIDDCFFFDCF